MIQYLLSYSREKVLYLRGSDFFRQVALLTTGSLIAQIITIAASPIVTRIYSPDTFGIMALFISIVGPLAVISTMSYPIAIVIPKNRNHALRLARLSLYLAAIITTMTLLIGLIFGETILIWLSL